MTPTNSESLPSSSARIISRTTSELLILIVEDDPDFLELLLRQMMKISGADIFVASSFDEAVELLSNQPFQLVVCDWAIAAYSGPDIFRKVDPLMRGRERESRKIPVMFMSGSEKVGSTQNLRSFRYFEPVSFMLKNLGAPIFRIMAENILLRFNAHTEDPLPVYVS